MTQCQTCQSQLLHHLYGVLDDAETTALVAHLGDCPDCQAALDKARGQQHLLAAAARTEFANVRFEPIPAEAKPQITRVASSPRRFAPRRWAIAASILVLVGGPALWVATMWVSENGAAKKSPASSEMATLSERNAPKVRIGNGVPAEFFASELAKNKGEPVFDGIPRVSPKAFDPSKPDITPGKSDDLMIPGGGRLFIDGKAGAGGAGAGGAAGGGGKKGGADGGFGGGATLKDTDGTFGTIFSDPKAVPPAGLPSKTTNGASIADLPKTPPAPPIAADAAKDKDAKGDKSDDGKSLPDHVKKVLKELAPDAKANIIDPKLAARDHKGEPGAGQLTAGSFDDTRHASSFKRFLQTLSQNSFVGGIPNQFKGRHVTITVKDSSGMPVDNARVEIRSGNTSIQLVSRTDGRVIVVTPWDPLPDNAHWTVTVTPPEGEGGKAVTTECTMQMDKLDVVLPESRNMATRVLDLALVIDCTGSMGDELEYIKSEMNWIASSIKEKHPDVKQRYALIVYRDRGDEYVTRTFQFTDSIDKLLDNIKAQRAGGGGDLPEAVEKAMDEAMQLQWSSGRAARVLIHVADAPPHMQDFEYSLKAVDRIRKAGIAFYPVACSGYDPPCELHMRVSSLLTGGKFLFLTDDSGIGNSHAEPHVHDYHVERLAPLLVRMISSEIAGHQIEVSPQEIIRTVGNPAKTAPK